MDAKVDTILEDHVRGCLCHFAITIVCVAEARRCSDLDGQVLSPSTRVRTTGADRLKRGNYGKALQSAAEFHNTYDLLQRQDIQLEGHPGRGEQTGPLQDLTTKGVALLPLEFEAAAQSYPQNHNSATSISTECLSAIIARAQVLAATPKTYALFADIVLSSAESPANGNVAPLPLATAATLLTQIITIARANHDYDTVRASRWIRCVIQLCLDQHHQQEQQHPTGNNLSHQASTYISPDRDDERKKPPVKLIEDITNQAIILARQSYHQRNTPVNRSEDTSTSTNAASHTSPYPVEELEWLSTTLFNLGVDFYVCATTSISHDHNHEHEPHPPQESLSDVNLRPDPHAQAKKYTSLALELADILAAYPTAATATATTTPDPRHGGEGGDRGLLARVLRGKIRQGFGWVV